MQPSDLDNPFEAYDLDPRQGIAAVTARLRELAEEAKTDSERARIRAVWEELTMHPARRLEAALLSYPETRRRIHDGGPPPVPEFPEIEISPKAMLPRRLLTPLLGSEPPPPTPQPLDRDPFLRKAAP